MRAIVVAFLLLLSPYAAAQPAFKATQVAAFAVGQCIAAVRATASSDREAAL